MQEDELQMDAALERLIERLETAEDSQLVKEAYAELEACGETTC